MRPTLSLQSLPQYGTIARLTPAVLPSSPHSPQPSSPKPANHHTHAPRLPPATSSFLHLHRHTPLAPLPARRPSPSPSPSPHPHIASYTASCTASYTAGYTASYTAGYTASSLATAMPASVPAAYPRLPVTSAGCTRCGQPLAAAMAAEAGQVQVQAGEGPGLR